MLLPGSLDTFLEEVLHGAHNGSGPLQRLFYLHLELLSLACLYLFYEVLGHQVHYVSLSYGIQQVTCQLELLVTLLVMSTLAWSDLYLSEKSYLTKKFYHHACLTNNFFCKLK